MVEREHFEKMTNEELIKYATEDLGIIYCDVFGGKITRNLIIDMIMSTQEIYEQLPDLDKIDDKSED